MIALAVLVAHARAEGEDASYPWRVHSKDAQALGNRFGLSGFQTLVDARSPQAASDQQAEYLGFLPTPVPVRLSFDFRASRIERSYRNALPQSSGGGTGYEGRLDTREDRFGGGVSLGLTLFPENVPVELGVAVRAYERRERREHFRNLVPVLDTSSEGTGAITYATKVTLPLGLDAFSLAPYAVGRLPLEDRLDSPATIESGLTLTLSPGLAQVLAFHGSLAGVHREHGVTAMRYQAGISISFVPPGDTLLVRLHAFGEGLEYEGPVTSDVDFKFGIQLVIARWFTLEAGFVHRFVHSGFRDVALRRSLRSPDSRPAFSGTQSFQPSSIHERHTEDRYQAFNVSLGFLF